MLKFIGARTLVPRIVKSRFPHCMKAIIVFVLSCLSVFAQDSNDVQVVTTATTNTPNKYLETVEVFTRGGQTNLIRQTHTRGGVVLFRAQAFYCEGTDMGRYIYNGAETSIGSTPGAPYVLTYRFDSSNQLRSAIISTVRTNNRTPRSITIVTLDSFGFTNGVFYPRDGSWIGEANSLAREYRLP